MPTKYNRAGKQQPYVPAGNGDQSGEYRENAYGGSGSNSESFVGEKTKPEVEQHISTTPSTNEFINKLNDTTDFNDLEISDKLNEYLQDANQTCLNTTFKTVEKIAKRNNGKVFRKSQGTSYYRDIDKTIGINEKSLEKEYTKEGMTLFHELGHMINNNNEGRKSYKSWYGEETTRAITSERTDVFEDGKSLRETIREEIDEFTKQGISKQIRKEQSAFMKKELAGTNYNEKLRKESNDFIDNFYKEHGLESIKKEIKSRINWEDQASIDLAQKRLDMVFQNWEEQYPEYKKMYATRKEQNKLFNDAQNKWFKQTGMECVSDMWSSKTDMGFGIGHPRSYYNKGNGWVASLRDSESLIGDEFFATMWAARTLNYTECIESTKKYLPRSYEKFVKLAEMLEKGEEDGK